MPTLGAFDWSTVRGVPSAGQVTLASAPLAGVSNTLRVSITDSDGNDRDAVIDLVAAGDTIKVSDTFATGAVGTPVDNTTYWSFPFTVSLSFVADDEPDAGEDITVTSSTPGAWPDTDELALVLNVTDSTWDTTIADTLAAAIATTKSVIGNWDDSVDLPTTNQGRAALRLATLMAQQPAGVGTAQFIKDPTFQGYLTGQRRRFGLA